MVMNFSFQLMILTILTMNGCVRNPVTGKREFHMISEKAEIELGKQSRNQIVQEYGLYDNPLVQSYINEVGQKIVEVCERKNISYEFVILDTPLVNAFAVPGTVFLTRGILELMDDEAELATVIGHEIGHITGFHAVKMIQKAFGYQFLSLLSTVAVAVYGPTADDPRAYAVLNQATNFVASGFLSGYGREFELEADRSGLRYSILAGYEPDAMISFFKRMKSLGEEEVSGIGLFLRTHPPTDIRIKQIKKIFALSEEGAKKKLKKDLKTKGFREALKKLEVPSTQFYDHFEKYQEIIKSIPKAPLENPGTIKDRVYLNPSLDIRLEIPKGWKSELGFSDRSLVHFMHFEGKAQGELQALHFSRDPILMKTGAESFAGVTQSTQSLTSRDWAFSIEEKLRMEKRSGREAVYPIGNAYVGTYRGRDRLGRPAFYRILYVLKEEGQGSWQAFMLSCAALEESYIDYLVDFEKIMKGFNWIKQKN